MKKHIYGTDHKCVFACTPGICVLLLLVSQASAAVKDCDTGRKKGSQNSVVSWWYEACPCKTDCQLFSRGILKCTAGAFAAVQFCDPNRGSAYLFASIQFVGIEASLV